MAETPREDWDALALPTPTPFLEWDWLDLLETSGSVSGATGWTPLHLTARLGGRLVGAAPLYLKAHSEGEFVFDHPFADLAQRMGRRYYPKLVGMSPFTPARSYRFLTLPGADGMAVEAAMAEAAERLCLARGLSGCHFPFVEEDFRRRMQERGFSAWEHQGYVWENPGYRDFDDFLALFTRNQRRNVRREREALREAGVEVRVIPGEEAPEELFAHMHDFYVRTNARFGPWGCKFMTREFFLGLAERLRHRVAFSLATRKGRSGPLGLALLARKNDRMWGRYWGFAEDEEQRYLHFEVCYYTPMEWAITQNIRHYDPGMGGQHKVRRGFTAVPNASLHRYYDERLSMILRSHIDDINFAERREIDAINEFLPFA